MAQWAGQFTGRTHESKVKDIEGRLIKAIAALRCASDESFEGKRKSVVKLCERLLLARHKVIKARISKISETRSFEADSKKTKNLIQREKGLRECGLEKILIEFDINNLVKPR